MSENLKIVLREANILDVDRLVALHKTAWVAAYSDDIDSAALVTQDRESRAHFGEVFSGNSSATVWVAEEPAAKALGFCECEAKGPHEIRSLEVTMLYVNPTFTGRGIGSALLQRAIGDAPAYVWTRPGDSQWFYEHHGFGADGETGIFAGMRVIRMVR